MCKINAFFKLMDHNKATHLYFTAGSQPILKINGEDHIVKYKKMENDNLLELFHEIMSGDQISTFEKTGTVNFIYELPDLGRLKSYISMQPHGVAAAFESSKYIIKLKLFFGEIEIGGITDVEIDMFYIHGKIILSDAFKVRSDPITKKIQKYIDYSIRLNTPIDQKLDKDDELDRIRQEGKQYLDLEESDEWYVIWERTHRRKDYILLPGFGSDNRISMRVISA